MIDTILVVICVVNLVLLVEYVKLRSAFNEWRQGINALNEIMEDCSSCPHGNSPYAYCQDCFDEYAEKKST